MAPTQHQTNVFDAFAARVARRARAFVRRHDAHSFFMAVVPSFFAYTLLVDIFMNRPGSEPWLLWVFFTCCAALTMAALYLGRRLSHRLGFAAVVAFSLATLYFMSALGDVQSAVSSAQELPLLALYFGWFVRPPVGRILMLVFLAVLVVVLFLNPAFLPGGSLDAPSAVQMIVVVLFCFEIGAVLWRRSMRKIATDELTGAMSRMAFLDVLRRELARGVRVTHPVCLVVIDFDRFKELNDTQGHDAGDRALIDTVAHWRKELRSNDVIARTGGDEFALLLERIDATQAQQTMIRLREHSPHAWSWGIAQARTGDTNESLFSRADAQLYRFKSQPGRGRV